MSLISIQLVDYSLRVESGDWTYILGAECIKNVVRQTGEQVDDKPSFHVVLLNCRRIRNNLAPWTDEGCVKIEQNIDGKYNINNTCVSREFRIEFIS